MRGFFMLCLLLLLGHQLPEAQGDTNNNLYLDYINEIKGMLNVSMSTKMPSVNCIHNLLNPELLRSNLEIFLNNTQNITQNGSSIFTNLKEFRSILPPLNSTKKKIHFKDVDDIQIKLYIYLKGLSHFLNNSLPTTTTTLKHITRRFLTEQYHKQKKV